MTAKHFIEIYGDCEVVFSSYYKFTFNFVGETQDGNTIRCSVGGNSDEIYRLEVTAGQKQTVAGLEPYAATVETPDGTTLVHFYDY